MDKDGSMEQHVDLLEKLWLESENAVHKIRAEREILGYRLGALNVKHEELRKKAEAAHAEWSKAARKLEWAQEPEPRFGVDMWDEPSASARPTTATIRFRRVCRTCHSPDMFTTGYDDVSAAWQCRACGAEVRVMKGLEKDAAPREEDVEVQDAPGAPWRRLDSGVSPWPGLTRVSAKLGVCWSCGGSVSGLARLSDNWRYWRCRDCGRGVRVQTKGP